MNGEKILLAIGDIKDQYVMEFADVKLYKRKQKSTRFFDFFQIIPAPFGISKIFFHQL